MAFAKERSGKKNEDGETLKLSIYLFSHFSLLQISFFSLTTFWVSLSSPQTYLSILVSYHPPKSQMLVFMKPFSSETSPTSVHLSLLFLPVPLHIIETFLSVSILPLFLVSPMSVCFPMLTSFILISAAAFSVLW